MVHSSAAPAEKPAHESQRESDSQRHAHRHPRVMLDVTLRFVEIIFSRLISFPDDSLRFSFSDLNQIFRQHFAFGGLGGQMSQVECGGLAVLDCCRWHLLSPSFDDCLIYLRAYNQRALPLFQICNVPVAKKSYRSNYRIELSDPMFE